MCGGLWALAAAQQHHRPHSERAAVDPGEQTTKPAQVSQVGWPARIGSARAVLVCVPALHASRRRSDFVSPAFLSVTRATGKLSEALRPRPTRGAEVEAVATSAATSRPSRLSKTRPCLLSLLPIPCRSWRRRAAGWRRSPPRPASRGVQEAARQLKLIAFACPSTVTSPLTLVRVCRFSLSTLQPERSHVPVQGEGAVPPSPVPSSPAGLLSSSPGLQSEEYDASSVPPSLSSPLCSSSSSSQL